MTGKRCYLCGGNGYVEIPGGDGFIADVQTCGACNGSGDTRPTRTADDLPAAQRRAFEGAIRAHRHTTINVGYCGGCDVCGTTEEHDICHGCGWDQHDDPSHPYPDCAMACPTVEAAVAALGGRDSVDFRALWAGVS